MTGPRVVAVVVSDLWGSLGAEGLWDAQVWCRANGLDPGVVRVGAGCPVEVLSDDTIRWRRNVLTVGGRPQVDPVDDTRLLTEVVVSPLVVPLPAHLAVAPGVSG